MEDKFSSAEKLLSHIWESMKSNPLKTIGVIFFMCVSIPLGGFLYNSGSNLADRADNLLPTTETNKSNVSVDTNIGIIQTGKGNTATQNINQEAVYTWINRDSWEETFDGLAYHLHFVASEGIPPSIACLKIQSDADINTGHPGFFTFLYESSKPTKDYMSCFANLGGVVDMHAVFFSVPTRIDAQLIKTSQ